MCIEDRTLENYVVFNQKIPFWEYIVSIPDPYGEWAMELIVYCGSHPWEFYSFECKNQERLNIWESLKQAEDNCDKYTPAVVFKRNRTKTYIALELDKFLNIIGETNE